MARPPQQIDYRLLGKVSRLYYEEELTQKEIAEKLHLSRPKVSRLLNQARAEGIIQIAVISPPGSFNELEGKLERKYGLQEVVVTEVEPDDPQAAVNQKIGVAAADYLRRTVAGGDVIGVSWGRTLKAMVGALQPADALDTQVVQLIGGLGMPEAEVHATTLCQRMAQALNSRLTLIPAPGIVDNAEVKRILLSDRHVQAAFALFASINVAYVGIGAPTPTSVLVRDGSILRDGELRSLVEQGAVGDIALRFFGADGSPVRSEIDKRVIGISLDELAGIERVVGVAGGAEKVTTIRGALLGGYVDVLVSDQMTAEALL